MDIGDLRLHTVDIVVIVGYLFTLVMVGVYHSRQQKDLQDFFLAGREMRWLVVGLSLMAAMNSGLDYLMQPGAMIKFGVYTIVGSLTWLVLIPWACWVTMPMYRRLGIISAYEYLERRFDVRVRALTAAIFILWRLGWMATALYVPSLAISVATGGRIPVGAMVLTFGLVITFYTMIGGIRAVIWNDVIQFWIMFTGVAVTVWLCIANVEGGISGILAQFAHVGETTQVQPPEGAPTGPLSYFFIPMTLFGLFITTLVSRLTNYTGDQVMVQRFQTARSVTDARRGFVILAITDSAWMLALSFVGLALFAFFNARLDGLPEWASSKPDQLFPYFMAWVFPPGLTGLVIAAILAASISSIDSALNSITSVAMVDFIERFYWKRPNPEAPLRPDEERKRVRVSRLLTLVIAIIGISLSLNVGELGSLLEINNKLIGSFTGPMLGIYLLGMFSRRATAPGVLVGGVIGALVTMFVAFQPQIYQLLNKWFDAGLDPAIVISFIWPATFGFISTVIVGYLISLFTQSAKNDAAQKWTWSAIVSRELVE
jgi:SSS family transporter